MRLKNGTNDELYTEIIAFLESLGGKNSANQAQLITLHQLCTKAGMPSKPGYCVSCNRICLEHLDLYVRTHESK